MVPVLSRIIVSTSPHASTAFPDMAITLNLVTRSIPAIPIAESRPPIVVGMRHTIRAISQEIGICTPRYCANGYRDTITIRKIKVSTISSVFSAISFGDFCLDAPSTSAIILSRKDCPGSATILIFNQSETTVVPPVTEEKSPPASLVTGADSPVIADSSTDATPSMISPSFGITSPVFTSTISPFFSSEALITFSSPFARSSLAFVSCFVFFKEAACTFPLPSATDSAKFANNTVTNSTTVTTPLYTRYSSLPPNSVGNTVRIRVNRNPISTTNMTGFFIM